MKELSVEQMEVVNGGSPCGAVVGLGVFVAAGMLASAVWAPHIWASPKTWHSAATIVAGTINLYDEHCLK